MGTPLYVHPLLYTPSLYTARTATLLRITGLRLTENSAHLRLRAVGLGAIGDVLFLLGHGNPTSRLVLKKASPTSPCQAKRYFRKLL